MLGDQFDWGKAAVHGVLGFLLGCLVGFSATFPFSVGSWLMLTLLVGVSVGLLAAALQDAFWRFFGYMFTWWW